MSDPARRVDDAARPLPDADADAARLLATLAAFLDESSPGQSRRRPPRLDSPLEGELGIDSLGRVELLLRIEQAFGRRLPEALLAAAETPGDLLRALRPEGAAVVPAAQVDHAAPAPQAPADAAPASARTLVEVLEWHAQAHGDRVHLTLLDGDAPPVPLTYAALLEDARRAAAGLQAAGIGPGERVAIMLPTGRDFFVAFQGALVAGAVPVPIYPPARLDRIAEHLRRQSAILANCGARALVTIDMARPVARLLRGQVATLERVTTVSELLGSGATLVPTPRSPDDIAFLQYTSGSTGNPKGVVLTHANLLANIRAMGAAAGASGSDVFVSWLPLYHDMGLIGAWLGSLHFAMSFVVMPPTSFLARPSRWLWAVHRYRGTFSAAPNFAYELCASRLDERETEGLDLSSWRWAFNGAEAVSAATCERFAARYAPAGFDARAIAPVYGLAECALDLTFPPPRRGLRIDRIEREHFARTAEAVPADEDDAAPISVVACGRVLPGYELRIAGPGGAALPERREGRVQFRGPSATSGYYRNTEATAKLFDGDWLDTGDLGYIAESDLFVTGRAKDVVIRGGQHLHPQELEDAVGRVPGVRKGCTAVLGLHDRTSGTEKLVIVAETRERDEAAREQLRARIAASAVEVCGSPPDDIVLAPPGSVPKTSSGKIRRADTLARYERGTLGVRPAAAWRQLAVLQAEAAGAGLRRLAGRASGVAYGVYLLAATAMAALPAVACGLVLPRALAGRAMRALARALLRVSGIPVTVEGLERLPRGQAAVLVANHASYADGPILFAILPAGVAFGAKREFERHTLVRRLFLAVGALFVERHDVEQGIADAHALADEVRRGASLVIFPEGTFQRLPGLLPFRSGAFAIATEAQVPVVPVTLRGVRRLLPAGNWLPRRTAVRIIVGEPILPDGTGWAETMRLRAAAREAILRASGEIDRDAGG
jgi:1-acyl-sn-glycerol-3-phosphate acyltransferase